MSILAVMNDFLMKGKDLFQQLRSPEGATLSTGDLLVLKDQLKRLDRETDHLLKLKQERKEQE